MSKETKYEMEGGKFNLNLTDPESLKENGLRPTHWGNLVIPEGAKAGDTLKLSAWRSESKAGKKYLNGKCELAVMPEISSVSSTEDQF
tara:strand:- start:463 stop:726 length:264 start_codon:yes stop_codon:yes gene_type:complete